MPTCFKGISKRKMERFHDGDVRSKIVYGDAQTSGREFGILIWWKLRHNSQGKSWYIFGGWKGACFVQLLSVRVSFIWWVRESHIMGA